ncbi:hypothetical protein PFISCL1PPCAC_24975, partial [Pristionchus fissidentatus]
ENNKLKCNNECEEIFFGGKRTPEVSCTKGGEWSGRSNNRILSYDDIDAECIAKDYPCEDPRITLESPDTKQWQFVNSSNKLRCIDKTAEIVIDGKRFEKLICKRLKGLV